MRVTTVFKCLLRLNDVNVVDVAWFARQIVVTVESPAAVVSALHLQDVGPL